MGWLRSRKGKEPLPLPLPPPEMRVLVGASEPELFENASGAPIFNGLPAAAYDSVLDFGCGCGRLARQLMQQEPPPSRYLGLDLHAGMVKWCQDNLSPRAPSFVFRHHDVAYPGFNPGEGKPWSAPFPVGDDEFSLVIATSVFTHLTQDQTEAYLAEIARVLRPDGILLATWFLFDKRDFPMMNDEQNTLFINEYDVRNAVVYDRHWVREAARRNDLIVCDARPPAIRGFQWDVRMTPAGAGAAEVQLPLDDAPVGRKPPPAMPPEAFRIGTG